MSGKQQQQQQQPSRWVAPPSSAFRDSLYTADAVVSSNSDVARRATENISRFRQQTGPPVPNAVREEEEGEEEEEKEGEEEEGVEEEGVNSRREESRGAPRLDEVSRGSGTTGVLTPRTAAVNSATPRQAAAAAAAAAATAAAIRPRRVPERRDVSPTGGGHRASCGAPPGAAAAAAAAAAAVTSAAPLPSQKGPGTAEVTLGRRG
ncbi:unnamed protein product [Lampetra fluviatilis]